MRVWAPINRTGTPPGVDNTGPHPGVGTTDTPRAPPPLPVSLEGSRLSPARHLWYPPMPPYLTPTKAMWHSSDRGYDQMPLREPA